jgi:aryl-alcohol dehydrogenase-like predicted oxidoreductase
MEDQIGTLQRLKEEGKIRHIGLSEVSVAEIERVRRLAPIVSVQNRYNVADRQHDQVLDYCEREAIAFLPWFPLATGALARATSPLTGIAEQLGATPAQVALAWLLRRSPVTLPIPGTASVKHLEENVDAARLQLEEREYQQITSARWD